MAGTSSTAAATPLTSTTDGVKRNFVRSVSIQRSFQSSSEVKEPRGASGLARIASHARSETVMSDIPGGPARHFCGPATATSTCQSSILTSVPPKAETTSATSSAPCSWTIAPISPSGFSMPDGVSE